MSEKYNKTRRNIFRNHLQIEKKQQKMRKRENKKKLTSDMHRLRMCGLTRGAYIWNMRNARKAFYFTAYVQRVVSIIILFFIARLDRN